MTDVLNRPDTEPAGAPVWRRRGPLLIGAVVLVVVALVVTWLLLFAPVFAAKHVQVAGVPVGQRAAVVAAARVDSSTPLLRLDTAAIEHRVETLPGVASAQVRTSFPSTVTITVTPRVAVGYVEQNGTYVLVDRTGRRFETTATKPAALPLFGLPEGSSSTAAGAGVALVARSLPADLLPKVASIQALDPTAITVLLRDGRVIHWGSAADSPAKAAVLPALLTQPGRVYDVSDPDQVFVR